MKQQLTCAMFVRAVVELKTILQDSQFQKNCGEEEQNTNLPKRQLTCAMFVIQVILKPEIIIRVTSVGGRVVRD